MLIAMNANHHHAPECKTEAPYAISSLGQYRHQPSSQAYYSDNSPFIEYDDEDDDQYSAYFPSGKPSLSSRQQKEQSGGRFKR